MSGKELAKFALSKLGVPYVYGAKGGNGVFTLAYLLYLASRYLDIFTKGYVSKAKRFVGQVCCDCSGLISWYTGKNYGSAQLYAKANERHSIKDIANAPIGAVLWRSGHVGVYIGNGYCVEERGIAYGCVKSKVSSRNFTHYLLFDWMEYKSVKEFNPYQEPIRTLSYVKGNIMQGNDVAWLQWELRDAGYDKVEVDKWFGKDTLKYLKLYQKSCKILVDGKCGPETRKKFKAD